MPEVSVSKWQPRYGDVPWPFDLALKAHGIHDLYTRQWVTARIQKETHHGMSPILYWFPWSRAYLAVGYVVEDAEEMNGLKRLAFVQRRTIRFEDHVYEGYAGSQLYRWRTVPFPDAASPRGFGSSAEESLAVCDSCFLLLPASGVCDNC